MGIEVGRWVRVSTQPDRGGGERERDMQKQRETERERPLPGHSGNLSRHPTRKSSQDNISKLRRTQT